jgi:hypothetical protein
LILKQNCPNKLYSFNRFPGIKFRPPNTKDITVQSREECQDRCLSETGFICRSAAFETSRLRCYLSDLTVESAPDFKSLDSDFDYLENSCLTGESRCKGINQFIVEELTELTNPKDAMVIQDVTSEQCRKICRDDNGLLPFYCKSFHFNQSGGLCLLSEHKSGTVKNSSNGFTYHEAICIQGGNLEQTAELDFMAISQSFIGDEGIEPFKLLRNTFLEAEPYAVYQEYDLGRCLDECLHRDVQM